MNSHAHMTVPADLPPAAWRNPHYQGNACVPEPGTGLMACVAALLLLRRARGRRGE